MYLRGVFGRRAIVAALFVLTCLVGWLGRDALAERQRPPALDAALEASMPPPVVVPAKLPPPLPPPKLVHLAFTGDVSMSLAVAPVVERQDEPQFPFADVADRLRGYDLLVGNFECVVTSPRGEPAIREPLVAPEQAPKRLVDAGFDLVTIANNHTLDLGHWAYFDMLEKLDAAGLGHFGSTIADHARDPIAIREVAGVRIALIGHMNREEKRAIDDIARARRLADVVIVFEHWGIEYALYPVRHQRLLGRTLIDAGADVVLGAHAHIVQPIEIYKGRLIAYGLGNFVFSSMVRRGTHTGAVLELDVDQRGITAHRFRSVTIDARGAPHWNGEATAEPVFDPPGARPLEAL